MSIIAYTDYTHDGFLRKVKVIGYDCNKYVTVIDNGVKREIKAGYIYAIRRSYKERPPRLSKGQLHSLCRHKPKCHRMPHFRYGKFYMQTLRGARWMIKHAIRTK